MQPLKIQVEKNQDGEYAGCFPPIPAKEAEGGAYPDQVAVGLRCLDATVPHFVAAKVYTIIRIYREKVFYESWCYY